MDDSAIRSDFTHNHEELAGRTSIVTGSTSGIGLGIARAFAAAGMNVVLNGFGNQRDIDEIRRTLETEFGIAATHSTR
jgi:3-hydroxybutyrate dehydrogenase